MRDPKRIPDVLAKIHELWSESPDLRLIQLLINSIKPDIPCPQIYYIEDDELLEKLEEISKQHC